MLMENPFFVVRGWLLLGVFVVVLVRPVRCFVGFASWLKSGLIFVFFNI